LLAARAGAADRLDNAILSATIEAVNDLVMVPSFVGAAGATGRDGPTIGKRVRLNNIAGLLLDIRRAPDQ